MSVQPRKMGYLNIDEVAAVTAASANRPDTEEEDCDEGDGSEDPFSPSKAFERVELVTINDLRLRVSAIEPATICRSDARSSRGPENPRQTEEDEMGANGCDDGAGRGVEEENEEECGEEDGPPRGEGDEIGAVTDGDAVPVVVPAVVNCEPSREAGHSFPLNSISLLCFPTLCLRSTPCGTIPLPLL